MYLYKIKKTSAQYICTTQVYADGDIHNMQIVSSKKLSRALTSYTMFRLIGCLTL